MGTRIDVDPRLLRVPSSRFGGADPYKLARQIAQHGSSIQGMPPIVVIRGKDGELQIFNGVTRATRIAKLLPGQTVPVEIIDDLPRADFSQFPRIGDLLP